MYMASNTEEKITNRQNTFNIVWVIIFPRKTQKGTNGSHMQDRKSPFSQKQLTAQTTIITNHYDFIAIWSSSKRSLRKIAPTIHKNIVKKHVCRIFVPKRFQIISPAKLAKFRDTQRQFGRNHHFILTCYTSKM